MMELSYSELLYPGPIRLNQVGSLRCPRLSEIFEITVPVYQMYLDTIAMEPFGYYRRLGEADQFDVLGEETKASLNIFKLLTEDHLYRQILTEALNFFFEETVLFEPAIAGFLTYPPKQAGDSPSGCIVSQNWIEVANLILARNYQKADRMEPCRLSNKKAYNIYQKLQKGRERHKAAQTSSPDLEIGNIISAVSNNHPTINPLNIYELTIYQLWDSFYRLCYGIPFRIKSTSVAVWGDEKRQFDMNSWYQRMQLDR